MCVSWPSWKFNSVTDTRVTSAFTSLSSSALVTNSSVPTIFDKWAHLPFLSVSVVTELSSAFLISLNIMSIKEKGQIAFSGCLLSSCVKLLWVTSKAPSVDSGLEAGSWSWALGTRVSWSHHWNSSDHTERAVCGHFLRTCVALVDLQSIGYYSLPVGPWELSDWRSWRCCTYMGCVSDSQKEWPTVNQNKIKWSFLVLVLQPFVEVSVIKMSSNSGVCIILVIFPPF